MGTILDLKTVKQVIILASRFSEQGYKNELLFNMVSNHCPNMLKNDVANGIRIATEDKTDYDHWLDNSKHIEYKRFVPPTPKPKIKYRAKPIVKKERIVTTIRHNPNREIDFNTPEGIRNAAYLYRNLTFAQAINKVLYYAPNIKSYNLSTFKSELLNIQSELAI